MAALSGSFGGLEAGARGAAPTGSLSLSPESTPVMPAEPCPSRRRRSGRDFPDLMVHMVEGVQPAQRGADPIRTHRRQGRGVATKSAGSAGGGEHDAGSFQLGLNPYPFDVTLRAGRVLPKLVWDVQHLAGLH